MADASGGGETGADGAGGGETDADHPPVVYGRERVDEGLSYDAVATTLAVESLPTERLADFEERTEAQSGRFLAVPDDTERGERLREAFGGVAALLRFPVE